MKVHLREFSGNTGRHQQHSGSADQWNRSTAHRVGGKAQARRNADTNRPGCRADQDGPDSPGQVAEVCEFTEGQDSDPDQTEQEPNTVHPVDLLLLHGSANRENPKRLARH